MSIRLSGPWKRLRRGLWSPEEDAKLMNHVSMYGLDGCWSYFAKAAGIERCGKSCRLRWLNYLRPGLKRGAFSVEEEDLIVHLHSIMGNRWSQIAARLPGRTDNEVKNFWHSFVKKKLRLRGIDPITHKPVTETDGSSNRAAVAADTATRPGPVFSEAEDPHLVHAPQATPAGSTDASVVVRSDVAMVTSGCTCNQTGDFTCCLKLDTGALQCVCVPSGIVHPAAVSSSSTVCSTACLSSTGTIEQCNDNQLWLEPGWMGTCTAAAADNYGAGATLDDLKWSDCVFDSVFHLHC